jgi:hypothetical protein
MTDLAFERKILQGNFLVFCSCRVKEGETYFYELEYSVAGRLQYILVRGWSEKFSA